MESHRLIHMANQIGAFFAAESERSAALEGIANHLKRFWDPRMRKQIVQAIDSKTADGLEPLVEEAIQVHRDRLLAVKQAA